jgi:magnesium transporter
MAALNQDNLDEPLAAHVRRDYAALNLCWTVGQALESLRTPSLGEKIVYLYVVDDANVLVGVVPTRRLLMSRPEQLIRDIMIDRVISVPESMTVLDACEFFVMHRLLAFPVVDAGNRLVGVIDVALFTDELSNMYEVSERQLHREMADVFQLIGMRLAQGRHGSPWAGFKDRFPWLLCNIAGGTVCALVAGQYEEFLDSVIVLALFIPVVLTVAEGVSIQSMTITLQGFREEKVDWKSIFRSLRMELFTAVLLGAASGALVGLVAWIWKREGMVALSIGLSIWLAIITACLLGVVLPAIVRLLKGDPRVAAGPVVLASADVATLLFYFTLSAAILR